MTFERLPEPAATGARSGRRWLRAILVTVVTSLAVVFGAQPAMAIAIVEPGKSGHICGDYFPITSTLKYQLCTWASANGNQSRIWFTAHFSNRGASEEFVYYIDIAYRKNGSSLLRCRGRTVEENQLLVPARGVRATTDDCWIPRAPGAYQADVFVVDPPYNDDNFSPTLNVR
jgi:hypothetical protein